ncbi:MAG: hypothetical protein ABFR95_11465 [Actinomycetota bacterium]
MGTTLDIYLDEYSDQELVDLYTDHSPGAVRRDATHAAIHRASAAAYALERRGYVEQAGTWIHTTHPALRATA